MTIGDLYESINNANKSLINIDLKLKIYPTGIIYLKNTYSKGNTNENVFIINETDTNSTTEEDLLNMLPSNTPIVYPNTLYDKDLYEDDTSNGNIRYVSKFTLKARGKSCDYKIYFYIEMI